MSINYDNLWKLLIDKKINKTTLRDRVGISSATLAKLSSNKEVSIEVLAKICKVLDCKVEDVITICLEENANEIW